MHQTKVTEGKKYVHCRRETHAGDIRIQSAKKPPAATRTPTRVAPMPVIPRAPLLPLKAPVAVVPGEVLVDDPGTIGLDVLVMVEPKPEVEREGVPPEMEEVKVPVPDRVEDGMEEDKEEEICSPISNAPVSESVVVTSPTGDAWNVYPGPGGTTGITTVMVPSEVMTTFFNANVLRKMSLVRYRSNVAGSPEEVVQVTVTGLSERT